MKPRPPLHRQTGPLYLDNLPDRINAIVSWGVVVQAVAGETASGDQFVARRHPGGVLLAGIDGLGHGEKAAQAAERARDTLSQHPEEPLPLLMERCHRALAGTRGAVISLASINSAGLLTWLGVGNVNGLLLPGGIEPNARRTTLLLRGGVVGFRLPKLQTSALQLTPGDTLILTSDGIRSGFSANLNTTQPVQALADHIYNHYSRGTDDSLVLVARYDHAGGTSHVDASI